MDGCVDSPVGTDVLRHENSTEDLVAEKPTEENLMDASNTIFPAPNILQGKSTDQELVADARTKLGIDVNNHFNFAFVGRNGVGKSSLINAIRQLKDNHPDAAPVGEIDIQAAGSVEEIRKFPHPTHSHVVLWDFPGAEISSRPGTSFFEDNMLYAFDCILVLIADRFMEVDFEILKMAEEFDRPCAIVRTKADVSVKSIAEREEKPMQDACKDLRLQVDESFEKGLKDSGLISREAFFQLFIVSAPRFKSQHAYTLYDAETGDCDTSLDMMDEDRFLEFVTDSAKCRLPKAAEEV